ncbi:hypothetical protein ACIPC1_27610 [Streptomyces sp. NPDC087263]|uniref:hypothetical protein n=1 Tax=Streptomyces sp. NPDC087263 TaxID=3365773 RepID=UPI0037FD3A75
MRIRATVAAVSGALALSAFAVPGAHAADSGSTYRADATKVREAAHAATSGTSAFRASAAAVDEPYALDVTFSNIKVNKGKPIVVGATTHVTIPVTYTLTHAADVDITAADFLNGPYIYRGSFDTPDNFQFGDDPGTCTPTSSTVASCVADIDIYANEGYLVNSDAGAWKAAGLAYAYNGQDPSSTSFDITKVGVADQGGFTSPNVQRQSKLTVNAAPEPVKKGKTITVTGKLTRADWETNKYTGLSGQSVVLQFRKAGTTTYKNVKTIKSTSGGALKTTVKASVDGYYRYTYAGVSTVGTSTAAGDYIDVK